MTNAEMNMKINLAATFLLGKQVQYSTLIIPDFLPTLLKASSKDRNKTICLLQ